MTTDAQVKSLKTLRREANAGQAEAQFALGKYYADPDHAKDKNGDLKQRALKWFMKGNGVRARHSTWNIAPDKLWQVG